MSHWLTVPLKASTPAECPLGGHGRWSAEGPDGCASKEGISEEGP